jgi:hypothetical protein
MPNRTAETRLTARGVFENERSVEAIGRHFAILEEFFVFFFFGFAVTGVLVPTFPDQSYDN